MNRMSSSPPGSTSTPLPSAFTSATRRSMSAAVVGWSSRTCGVAAMRVMPSSSAASRIARLPARSRAPSSIPGRTCEWRSNRVVDDPGRSGGLDVHDLELDRPARRGDVDGLALLLAHDRLADRRLVRELVLRRIGLGGADDVVLDRLVRLHVAQAHLRPDRDLPGLDLLLRDDAGGLQALLEQRDAGLEVGLLVLRRVVLRVLGDVAELARLADAVRDLAALLRRQNLDLLLELLVALRRENDFLQDRCLLTPARKNRHGRRRPAGADGTPAAGARQTGRATIPGRWPVCAN